uniref:Uncharacterized protein n=1 Tax=Trichuris muris TaxID=70415 RepID=A0A5S6R252_TRIMR
MNSRKDRFGSISSETALLLNYEIPAACNAQPGDSKPSANSSSLLDEVFEALQQANLGFVDDQSSVQSTSKASTDKEPSSVHESSSPVEICCSERRHLIERTSSEKEEYPSSSISIDPNEITTAAEQQQSKLKPLSHRDSKMLDELTSLAVEMADKAMREQNEALRNLANGNSPEGATTKCLYSSLSSPLGGKKKLYESLLRFKGETEVGGERPSFCSRLPPEGEVKLSAESEKAYKSMVEEGLLCSTSENATAETTAKGCQQQTSVDATIEEEPENSLHMLRDDGAAVLRLLRASGRKPPCVPKAMATSFRADNRKATPPPVPPRFKEGRRSAEDIPSCDGPKKAPPPVPPKVQTVGKANVSALKSQFENCQQKKDNSSSDCLMTRSVIVESSVDRRPADLHFTMEGVDKYELLDFVLSSLPNENRLGQS